MLTRRAASPSVPTARTRRNHAVRDFRDRIRPGSGLLTHRPYPMSCCRCGECPAKSRQSVRPWQALACGWMSVKGVFFVYQGGRTCVSWQVSLFCGRCGWLSARSAVRVPASTDAWRTASAQRMSFCSICAGQRPCDRTGVAVRKTVGSAYVGSNPTPATTVMSQDIEDTANPRKGRGVFFGQPAGLPVG